MPLHECRNVQVYPKKFDDLQNETLLPGLESCHIHFNYHLFFVPKLLDFFQWNYNRELVLLRVFLGGRDGNRKSV